MCVAHGESCAILKRAVKTASQFISVDTLEATACAILKRAVKTASTQTKPACAGCETLNFLVRALSGLALCRREFIRLEGIKL
ncbi:MAG TPA: hypothetical protein DD379_24170 [Cyanobacteria bacterium UBA11162]|nr:hypothetical protein [Cyanobacteria bacterium UBA11162]